MDDKQGHVSSSSGRNANSKSRCDGTENKSLNKQGEVAERDNLIPENDQMDIQGRKCKQTQNENTECDIGSSQLRHQVSVNDLAIVPHVPGPHSMFEEPDTDSDDLE